MRRCAQMVRDKFVSVPVFSRKSRISRWNKLVVSRKLAQIFFTVSPATRARITIPSSTVNTGSGRAPARGMGTRFDGNFIRLRATCCRQMHGDPLIPSQATGDNVAFYCPEMLPIACFGQICRGRAQRLTPANGQKYKHAEVNPNQRNEPVQNRTLGHVELTD
jgi:hypothetical protein